MAYTTLGSRAETASPMRPMRSVGRPFLSAGSVTFVHVLPPSLDLYTPSPHHCERRELCSPLPTHTMFVSEGATATSPIVWTPSPSEVACQVIPPFAVFHTPPPAAPT